MTAFLLVAAFLTLALAAPVRGLATPVLRATGFLTDAALRATGFLTDAALRGADLPATGLRAAALRAGDFFAADVFADAFFTTLLRDLAGALRVAAFFGVAALRAADFFTVALRALLLRTLAPALARTGAFFFAAGLAAGRLRAVVVLDCLDLTALDLATGFPPVLTSGSVHCATTITSLFIGGQLL